MNRGHRKLSGIGGRTGKDVLLNKNVRKLADGRDDFEDYFTDSSSGGETTVNYSDSQCLGVSTRNSEALYKKNIQRFIHSSSFKKKSPNKVIGDRYKKNILPSKRIRKLHDGTDDFNDYFTDGSYENTSTFSSSIPENSAYLNSFQRSPKSKNSCEKSSAIAYSSPITRLSSSKALYENADNPSGSSEKTSPVMNNTFTKEIDFNKSKRSAKKSVHKKNDLYDEKLLKLAKDYEESENQSESTDNVLIKTTDKNMSMKKNVSKTSSSNSFQSELQRSKFPQSHFEGSTDHDSNDSYEVNPVSGQNSALFGNKRRTKKLSVKRKSNCKPNVASKKISNSIVASSMDGKGVEATKDLLDNGLNVTSKNHSQYLALNTEENLNDIDTQFNKKKKADLNSQETEIFQECDSESLKTVSGSPEEQQVYIPNIPDPIVLQGKKSLYGHSDANAPEYCKEFSEENSVVEQESTLNKNENVIRQSYVKEKSNIQRNKSVHNHIDKNTAQCSEESFKENGVAEQESTSYRNEVVRESDVKIKSNIQKNKSVHSHIGVNTTQCSEESFEENAVAEEENDSYGNMNFVRKSSAKRKLNLKPVNSSKKTPNSLTASAKKHMPADKSKGKISSSFNLSDENFNNTSKNEQNIDGLPPGILNFTFQTNNSELPLSSNKETLKETDINRISSHVSTEAHKNKENAKEYEQTNKLQKTNKSRKYPKPVQEYKKQDPIRKSTRKKFPPLESWRNERAHYRMENNSLHFIDIDPGTREDDGAIRGLITKLEYYKKKKEQSKKIPVQPPKTKFRDLILQKKVTVPLLKRYSVIPWEGQPSEQDPYRIKKVIQTPNSNFGFIEIKSGKSKPLQYIPTEDIYLCLIQGKVTALIEEKEITLEEKDVLVIPRSVPYTLTNHGNRKALLIFSVGRYNYLENVILG